MRIVATLACSLLALALPASASAIVGGTAVGAGSYPFVVAVGDTLGPDCGGTLITPTVVLTAAHCIVGHVGSPADLRVLAGSRAISADLPAEEADGHVVGVTAVYVHPKFSAATMHYDAALLILARPVTGVRTVPLASVSPPAGSTPLSERLFTTTSGCPSSPTSSRATSPVPSPGCSSEPDMRVASLSAPAGSPATLAGRRQASWLALRAKDAIFLRPRLARGPRIRSPSCLTALMVCTRKPAARRCGRSQSEPAAATSVPRTRTMSSAGRGSRAGLSSSR